MTINVAKKFDNNVSITLQRPWDKAPEADASAFSGNFVIEFARARINHVNSFLNRQLTTMQNGARDSDAINGVMKALALHGEGFNGDAAKLQSLKDALNEAANKLPDGYPLKDRLLALANDDNSPLNIGKDTTVTKLEIDAVQKDLEGALKSIDRRSQEDQLYINQKMGEKSEILNLAAMLIQSMNETIKQIQGRS